jgi:hypothetical protein
VTRPRENDSTVTGSIHAQGITKWWLDTVGSAGRRLTSAKGKTMVRRRKLRSRIPFLDGREGERVVVGLPVDDGKPAAAGPAGI